MSTGTHKITPDDVRNLLPLLSEKDQVLIFITGMRTKKSRLQLRETKIRQDSIRNKLATIQTACEQLGVSTKGLLENPLNAPIEVLDIPPMVRQILESRGSVERVRDVYRLKLTTSVCLAAGATEHDVVALDSSLKRLDLPGLQVSEADSTMIYRLYDLQHSARLDINEVLLLEQREWGNVDPCVAAEAAGLPGVGLIWPIIDIAKNKLLRD
ncbi:MAG: hypothetical protein WD335_02505 [Candidatus Paceibacterota bacterium]